MIDQTIVLLETWRGKNRLLSFIIINSLSLSIQLAAILQMITSEKNSYYEDTTAVMPFYL